MATATMSTTTSFQFAPRPRKMSRPLQIRLMNDRIENMKIMIQEYQEAKLAASRVEKLIERVKVMLDEQQQQQDFNETTYESTWVNESDEVIQEESELSLHTFDTSVMESASSSDSSSSLPTKNNTDDDSGANEQQRIMEVSKLTEAYEEETVKFHFARRSDYDPALMDETQARIGAIVDASDTDDKEQPMRRSGIGQIILNRSVSWRKNIARFSSRSLHGTERVN
mmetsp:Transcript_18017/g.26797  ORF Transcript_18017/g.26797 Transcript_18017/m.26797 type:complete len:226 (-) Transcript_18017:52-729(-)